MIGKITESNLGLRFMSLEWSNFFGLPSYLVIISIINISFLFRDFNRFIVMAIVTILMAIVTFYLQSRKLKWKVLAFKDSKMAYASIKEVLLNEDWIVNANKEKTMIQATRKNSLELLTLVIEKDKIKWNLIHHPYDRNAFLSLFASNKNGKRMIGRLKTAANNSDQLRPEISQL